MLAAIRHHWFLLALIVVLWAGLARPETLHPLARWLPGEIVVATVTFIMALPLETSALWKAARQPGPAWLATALNSGMAPLLGWVASRMLPIELATGVIVATTVPCTLATAAVWTRRAGGNDAVAFLVTIITNLSCFLVVPAWLWLLVRPDAQAQLRRADVDYLEIVVALILLVVLPIIAAQTLRQWPALGGWASRKKHPLSHLAQCGVLLIVFLGAIDSAGNVGLMILAVALVHIALLVLGLGLAQGLRFPRADAIAVAFSGSQKTLMVGAYLALAIGPLAILPMVAYHAAQLVIDTLVADWFRRQAPGQTFGQDQDSSEPPAV
jgi:sodium/bile acid cotransporter 7